MTYRSRLDSPGHLNTFTTTFTDDVMTEDTQPRFLITRLSALGDCLVTLPVACCLRDHFPLARIVWLTQQENAPLLRAHADIDDVITVNRRWFRRPLEVMRLRDRLQSERFTTVIDPQSLSKSSSAGWLSGCKERIGLSAPAGREIAPLLNTINVPVKEDSHVVDRFLALLRPLGIDRPDINFRVPVHAAAHEKMQTFIQQNHLSDGFIVINPGAGWKSRQWSIERYGQVASELHQQFGLRTVVPWYGELELQWARDVSSHSRKAALIAEPLDLFGLSALMHHARLFIGSDCGPMHLAAAVGTPCVSLHGTTRPENSGPYGKHHHSLQMYYHSGSSRVRRTANNEAMLAIQVSHVVDAARKILVRKQTDLISLKPALMAAARTSHL